MQPLIGSKSCGMVWQSASRQPMTRTLSQRLKKQPTKSRRPVKMAPAGLSRIRFCGNDSRIRRIARRADCFYRFTVRLRLRGALGSGWRCDRDGVADDGDVVDADPLVVAVGIGGDPTNLDDGLIVCF